MSPIAPVSPTLQPAPQAQQTQLAQLGPQSEVDFGKCFVKQACSATVTLHNQSDILQRVSDWPFMIIGPL